MKKFFPVYDIKAIDKATTTYQGIDYTQLVERAARALCDWVLARYTRRRVIVLAGPGNNGADGLALALLLNDKEWMVEVHIYTGFTGRRSESNEEMMRRICKTDIEYDENNSDIETPPGCLVIDALFGTGLKREMAGPTAEVAQRINEFGPEVVSVDIPSGLGGEESYVSVGERTVIRARHTVSFQFPKMAFFLPELYVYIGQWHVVDIRLDARAIAEAETFMFYMDYVEAARMLKPRSRFSHKGTMGHALLVAGSEGMSGAAILASRACLRSGAGLLTVATARMCQTPVQTAVPEAMAVTAAGPEAVANWGEKMEGLKITAFGIGPGLGRAPEACQTLRDALATYGGKVNLVVDADGLYALRQLLDEGYDLPRNTILTPHPVEFDRLTEHHATTVERIEAACLFAIRHRAIVVLKGAFTMVALPDGRRVFNTTGNGGMATAGSGDVLTGIVLGLLAQGYAPREAAVLGVSLHAAAGDMAADELSQEAMLSSDIVAMLGKTFKKLHALAQ